LSAVFFEEAKDVHSKNAKLHEAFSISTVESMVNGEDESTLFNQQVEILKKLILYPNRTNSQTMLGNGTELNFTCRPGILERIPVLEFCVERTKKYLVELNLTGTNMTVVPECIDQLKTLEILVLGENLLTTLPETLGELTDLKILVIEKNNLEAFPKCLALLTRLQEIWAADNRIERLPIFLAQLKSLQKLHVIGNPIKRPVIGKLLTDKKVKLQL